MRQQTKSYDKGERSGGEGRGEERRGGEGSQHENGQYCACFSPSEHHIYSLLLYVYCIPTCTVL